MKKPIAVFMVFIMMLSLSGCGASPKSTISQYFKAAKTFDLPKMNNLLLEQSDFGKTDTSEDNKDDNNMFVEYFMDYLKSNAQKIEYDVTGSKIDGDKASVQVDCKYVDGSIILKTAMAEYFKQAFGYAFSGEKMSDEAMDNIMTGILTDVIDKSEETIKEVSITINCVKKDGSWLIDDVDNALLNIVTSGFTLASEEISESLD